MRVAPYATFGTPELAEVALDALEGRAAALMANHGAIAFRRRPRAAVEQSLLLEWGCELYWRAAALGTPRVLDADEQRAVVDAAVARNYGTTRERADDAEPKISRWACTSLDVLARPIEEIPEGQGGALVDRSASRPRAPPGARR